MGPLIANSLPLPYNSRAMGLQRIRAQRQIERRFQIES